MRDMAYETNLVVLCAEEVVLVLLWLNPFTGLNSYTKRLNPTKPPGSAPQLPIYYWPLGLTLASY